MKKQTKTQKINCAVGDCAYNQQHNCSLGQIDVGASASKVTQAKNTECDSFHPKGQGDSSTTSCR